MAKIESKIGKIAASSEKIYNFLSDFRNFESLIPPDKIKDWQATEDNCKFTIDGIGQAGIQIIQKEPHKLIKLGSAEGMSYNFNFWMQIKEAAEEDSRIKLTMDLDLNPMMMMMAKNPIKNFLDKLVDELGKRKY